MSYPNEIEDLIKYNLSTSLSNSVIASAISKKAEQANKSVGVHIKIDTGMGRLGIQPEGFISLLNNVISYKLEHNDHCYDHSEDYFIVHLVHCPNAVVKTRQTFLNKRDRYE